MNKCFVMAVALASTMPAAAVGAPPPLKEPVPAAPVQDWLAASDYPVEPAARAVVRVLNFALTVSPRGSVIRCAIEGSTGSPTLDAKACALLEQRGRFQPALDSGGIPATGVWRGRALWATPGNNIYIAPMIEMAVALQTMPGGLADPAYLDIAVSVDATGRANGCVAAVPLDLAGKPVPSKVEAGRILSSTACAQAVGTLKLDPAKTAEGNPVGSVQTARVLFTARPAELAAGVGPRGRGTGEAKITTKGFNPIVDYQAIGNELVLVQAYSGEWYRMELQPFCIGTSRLSKISKNGAQVEADQEMVERLPRRLRDALFYDPASEPVMDPRGGIIIRNPAATVQSGLNRVLPPGMTLEETLNFATNADGSFDRRAEVVATTIDERDVVRIESCRIRSLVPSDPPTDPGVASRKK